MRLSQLVITLPILFCTTQMIQPLSLAQAAGMDATAATALLAKSQAIDVKCSVLAKDQSQSLKDFVARAEIALAGKASVAVARKTISAGRAEGKTAGCDGAAQKLVNDVLAAAITAASAPIDDATTTMTPEPQAIAIAIAEPEPVQKKQAVLVKPQKPRPKIVVAKSEKAAKPVKPVKGLGSYAAVAEKYYVATRCGSMSASNISQLYQTVLASHHQAMANNRHGDIKNMLRAVEARAGARSCR